MVTTGHEATIVIGVQSTAYTGPLDVKWDIVIGGGTRGKFLLRHFIYKKINNGFGNPNNGTGQHVGYNHQNNR